jgi:hypothetical protein
MTSSSGVIGWTGTSSSSPNATGARKGSQVWDHTPLSPRRVRSSGCMWSLRHAVRASWRLVEAAAALASREGHRQLHYWVGVDNGRAIGVAKNFGFRSTGARRPSRLSDLALGDYETALVLSLVPDDTSVPNPTSGKPAPREGPIG